MTLSYLDVVSGRQLVAVSAAVLATGVSVLGLTPIVLRSQQVNGRVSLSIRAASSQGELALFQGILYLCAPLFMLSLGWIVLHKGPSGWLILLVGTLMCVSEIALAYVPAAGIRRNAVHNIFARLMALCMFILAVTFTLTAPAGWLLLAGGLLGLMIAMAIGTVAHKAQYVWYELAYIYTSHVTIVVAALAATSNK